MQKARRCQIEILVELLTLTSTNATWFSSPYGQMKGMTKSHLAYKTGLNFRRLEKYLNLLLQRKLIELVKSMELGDSNVYRTTASGDRMLLLLLEAEKLIIGNGDEYNAHFDNYEQY